MCGIAGFVTKQFSLQEKNNIIRKMGEKLVHRGPDSDGYFVIDEFAVGMRRLKIIDMDTGDQPIFNKDKSRAIVFNGEIYNYREIREKLQARGHQFKTNSDTEVILQLYEDDGIHCVDKLKGMFAFAILDLKLETIFLARDPMGIKPLYYFFDGTSFIFASELKSLLEFPSIRKEINYDALNYYLTFEFVPAPLTIFKNIQKLEQGHFLEYEKGKLKKQQYYYLNYQPKYENQDEKFYLEELEWLVDAAVQRRKMSDVPLGSFLSGGIDSSLIAAHLSKNYNGKIKTFSIGFQEKSFDESGYARIVARHLGTDHHEQQFTSDDLLAVIPKVMKNMAEPFADASILPTYLLSKFTSQQVTVALSGDGGDEIFAGYPTYYARKIARFFPRWSYYLLNPIVNLLPASDENISADFKAKRFVAGLPYRPNIRHQIWLGSFDNQQKKNLLSAETYGAISKGSKEFDIIKTHMRHCTTEKNWERSLWLDMRFYLQDNMLVKVDRASMLNSLEVRVPFLDRELVEFMARVPSRLKYKGNISKYLLKQLARQYLPKEIINRPKKGFGIPVAKWIKKELKAEFCQTLSKRKIKDYNIFNYEYIARLLNQHFKGKKDNRKLLWTLYIFQKWLENYYA